MFGCSCNLSRFIQGLPLLVSSEDNFQERVALMSSASIRSALNVTSLNSAKNFREWDRLSCLKSGRGVYSLYFKTRVSKLQFTSSTRICCNVYLKQSLITERDGEVFIGRENVTLHEIVCKEHAPSAICENAVSVKNSLNAVSVKNSPNVLAVSEDKSIGGEELSTSGCLDDGILTDKEKLRRLRISQKNRGKVAWNKGKKHKPETIELIKRRTTEAMLRPAVTEKLRRNSSKPMHEAIKMKISRALRKVYAARRKMKLYRLECVKAWKNQVAEAARVGDHGEEELQWNSHYEFKMKLNREYAKELRLFERMKKHGFEESVGYSVDHRKSISEAMKEKWKNEDFRTKASTGRQNYFLSRTARGNTEEKDSEVSSDRPVVDTSGSCQQDLSSAVQKICSYVDPKTSEKLERLRRLQASRLVTEMKKHEAAERARLLMMEAEKAAKALEAAAHNNKFAKASLAETRRLLAAAAESIQTVESKKFREGVTVLQRHTTSDGIDNSKASTSSPSLNQKSFNSSEAIDKGNKQSQENVGELKPQLQPHIIGQGDTFDLIDSWIIHENPEKFMTLSSRIRKFQKTQRLSLSQSKTGATDGSVFSLNSLDRESLTLPLNNQNLNYSLSPINIPDKSNHIDINWNLMKKPKGSKKWHCGRLVPVENEEFR